MQILGSILKVPKPSGRALDIKMCKCYSIILAILDYKTSATIIVIRSGEINIIISVRYNYWRMVTPSTHLVSTGTSRADGQYKFLSCFLSSDVCCGISCKNSVEGYLTFG